MVGLQMLNWKLYGKKRPWPTLRCGYYPIICQEELKKGIKTSVRTADYRDEHRTRDLQKAKLEC
jgi:hypothetical protein